MLTLPYFIIIRLREVRLASQLSVWLVFLLNVTNRYSYLSNGKLICCCCHHILTTFVIWNWKDTLQTGVYFVSFASYLLFKRQASFTRTKNCSINYYKHYKNKSTCDISPGTRTWPVILQDTSRFAEGSTGGTLPPFFLVRVMFARVLLARYTHSPLWPQTIWSAGSNVAAKACGGCDVNQQNHSAITLKAHTLKKIRTWKPLAHAAVMKKLLRTYTVTKKSGQK